MYNSILYISLCNNLFAHISRYELTIFSDDVKVLYTIYQISLYESTNANKLNIKIYLQIN